VGELSRKSLNATHNRRVRQENLRESLRAHAYVRVLESIAAKADKLHKDDVAGHALKAKIYSDLLAKVLPDLKAVEHSGSIDSGKPEELTDARLAHIARSGSDRTAEAPVSQKEPSELH
jgi:hypothetical protein